MGGTSSLPPRLLEFPDINPGKCVAFEDAFNMFVCSNFRKRNTFSSPRLMLISSGSRGNPPAEMKRMSGRRVAVVACRGREGGWDGKDDVKKERARWDGVVLVVMPVVTTMTVVNKTFTCVACMVPDEGRYSFDPVLLVSLHRCCSIIHLRLSECMPHLSPLSSPSSRGHETNAYHLTFLLPRSVKAADSLEN